jgi:hypothetical protein
MGVGFKRENALDFVAESVIYREAEYTPQEALDDEISNWG